MWICLVNFRNDDDKFSSLIDEDMEGVEDNGQSEVACPFSKQRAVFMYPLHFTNDRVMKAALTID